MDATPASPGGEGVKVIATIHDDEGRRIGMVHGPDEIDQSVTVNGKEWRFDFDKRFGPTWLRKDGEPRKCQNPKQTVWMMFQEWLDKREKRKSKCE